MKESRRYNVSVLTNHHQDLETSIGDLTTPDIIFSEIW